MTPEEKKNWAENCLREKFHELGRLPRKGDFDGATRSRIKAFLGPWPRALESAGLKAPAPENDGSAKNKGRRTAAAHPAAAEKSFLHHVNENKAPDDEPITKK